VPKYAGNDVVETDRYVLFWSGWPSQWHPAKFEVDGVAYACCEQYMMAEKARVFGDADALAQILATPDPRRQKALGRAVRNFHPLKWESVCRGVVYAGNLARFAQDADLGRTLLATGDRTLVEASPLDRLWGVGLAPDDPRAQDLAQWQGRNWLGAALEQVRDALRRGTPDRPAEPDRPRADRPARPSAGDCPDRLNDGDRLKRRSPNRGHQ
jgi:ribA/ribD-fused uncharacterized protein